MGRKELCPPQDLTAAPRLCRPPCLWGSSPVSPLLGTGLEMGWIIMGQCCLSRGDARLLSSSLHSHSGVLGLKLQPSSICSQSQDQLQVHFPLKVWAKLAIQNTHIEAGNQSHIPTATGV